MAYSDAQRTNNSSRSVKTFSDLNLNFTRNPATGDVARLTDIEAVKRSVRNLILTNEFERPFHPEIGSSIRGLLFEIASDPDVSYQIEEDIEDALKLFEPRVTDVKVETDITNTGLQNTSRLDDNTISVKVTYRIINSEQVDVIQTTLARLR